IPCDDHPDKGVCGFQRRRRRSSEEYYGPVILEVANDRKRYQRNRQDERDLYTSPVRKIIPQYRLSVSPPPPEVRHTSVPKRMVSAETDTSMDIIKHDRGIQNETKPRKNASTMSDTESLITTAASRQQKHRHPISKRSIGVNFPPVDQRCLSPVVLRYREPLPTDRIERQKPHVQDQTTMADLNIMYDHFTQCDNIFFCDRITQTSDNGDFKQEIDYNNLDNERSYEEQEETIDLNNSNGDEDAMLLSSRYSISLKNPEYNENDELDQSQHFYHCTTTRGNRIGLDYTGEDLELRLQHGHIISLDDNNTSALNIGSINHLRDPTVDEYTNQFTTKYVNSDSNRISNETNKRKTLMMPVLNMSRAYLVEKQQLKKKDFSLPRQMSQLDNERRFAHKATNGNRIKSSARSENHEQVHRQSQSNGNFYFGRKPTTINIDSSFTDDTYSEIDTLTRNINRSSINSQNRPIRGRKLSYEED
ncbi:unnamed protein product, partial [Didymodactylos carnosus]